MDLGDLMDKYGIRSELSVASDQARKVYTASLHHCIISPHFDIHTHDGQ